MKLRTPAELRAIAEAASRERRDPLQAIYDAGRMDEIGRKPPVRASGYESFGDSVDRYVANIAKHRGVRQRDILGKDVSRRVAGARSEVVWILRTVEDLSYPDITRLVRLENHTTCIHAFRRVEKRIKEEPELRGELLAVAAWKPDQEADVAPLRSVA